MGDRRHASEGRKPCPRRPYVAMVEGEERGVPFRVFYKRMDAAERDAIRTGGIVTCLSDLSRRRWVNDDWKEC